MKKERSSGAIVFTYQSGGVNYLVVKNAKYGHWGFPKGHIERGEDELRAALREVKEEVGIEELNIVPGFSQGISYQFEKDEEMVSKEVTFYLAEAKSKDVKLSRDQADYCWVDFDDALKVLSFDDTKAVLQRAEDWLKRRE